MSLWVKRGDKTNSRGVFSAFHLRSCDLYRLPLASLLIVSLSHRLTLWIGCLFLFFNLLLLTANDQFIQFWCWRATELHICLANWCGLLRLFRGWCFLTRFFGPGALTLLAFFGCWWCTAALLFIILLHMKLLLLLGTIAPLSFLFNMLIGRFWAWLKGGRHEELLLRRGRIDQVLQILVQSLGIRLRQMLIREDPLHYVLLIFFLYESTFNTQALVSIVFADGVGDFFHPDALLSLF